jgi:hypothetical protein
VYSNREQLVNINLSALCPLYSDNPAVKVSGYKVALRAGFERPSPRRTVDNDTNCLRFFFALRGHGDCLASADFHQPGQL